MAEVEGNFVTVIFSTNTDESIRSSNENPDLFIAHAVAKLHGGKFIVDTSNDIDCNLIFTLSMTAIS